MYIIVPHEFRWSYSSVCEFLKRRLWHWTSISFVSIASYTPTSRRNFKKLSQDSSDVMCEQTKRRPTQSWTLVFEFQFYSRCEVDMSTCSFKLCFRNGFAAVIHKHELTPTQNEISPKMFSSCLPLLLLADVHYTCRFSRRQSTTKYFIKYFASARQGICYCAPQLEQTTENTCYFQEGNKVNSPRNITKYKKLTWHFYDQLLTYCS